MGPPRWQPGLSPVGASEPVVVATVRSVPTSMKATVADGLRLAAQNVVASVVLDARARELAAVRTRLVSVEEDERVALVDRLRSGPLAALVDVRANLTAHGAPSHLIEHVRHTERDIERVASGLDPLDQFASAIDAVRALAEQLGAAFEVAKDAETELTSSLPDAVVRALWYAGSEALTNAAKHAPESHGTGWRPSAGPWLSPTATRGRGWRSPRRPSVSTQVGLAPADTGTTANLERPGS